MTTSTANLRKAAILLRSLDSDTAATVLARLSPAEAKEIRQAIRALGEIDADERADVSAEFRRSGTIAHESPERGVELELSTSASATLPAFELRRVTPSIAPPRAAVARPFEFLEQARVESLVPYLAREHAQTVAVVLTYLAPDRAAQVLAALPGKQQAAVVERLSTLGETDPSSLEVLERELADWVARQQASRNRPLQRTETVAAILAAATADHRAGILANLSRHNALLASQFAVSAPGQASQPQLQCPPAPSPREPRAATRAVLPLPVERPPSIVTPPRPQLHFDDLVRLEPPVLAAVLKSIDADVLVLALVGASEPLVARITGEMPAKLAKAFRQRLNHCGPTRLRDVEMAQQEVTHVASELLARRVSQRPVAA